MVTSPDFLATPTGRGVGVRRLNRRPLVIAGVIVCLLLAAVSYTYQMRLADQRRRNADRLGTPEPAGIPAILKDAPEAGLIQPRLTLPPEAALTPPAPPVLEKKPEPAAAVGDPYAQEWAQYRQALARMRQAREQASLQAARASTTLKNAAPGARPAARDTAPEVAPSTGSQLASLYAAELRQRGFDREDDDEDRRDINRAAEKRAFLSDRSPESASSHYLPGGREAPFSPYEIKAGTVISATMIGGVQSDLPGQILGQVSENIYDSATGRFILIPQGSKLVGTYDNAITTGQERVLVAWTRIILPDSSSIDLGKMPGSDQSGLAGFHDKVDNHFWKMFSSALMLSVLSAGVQISQGGQSPSANGLNAQQSIAAGLGQQFGQLGQELARRNSRIQPTLEIRPGYRFTVSVTKDMALRPWIARTRRYGQ
jgi:type IV secretion system protein VirB10